MKKQIQRILNWMKKDKVNNKIFDFKKKIHQLQMGIFEQKSYCCYRGWCLINNKPCR